MIKGYSDSSFDEKRGIAGWGVIVQDGQKQRIYSNWIKARTVNEAELFAIYMAGILTNGQGVVYSDSQTAISYINKEIKDKPRTKQQYINHKHCEYWACKIRKLGVKVEKIKAHQKVFQTHALGNRFADLAANAGRAKFYENSR